MQNVEEKKSVMIIFFFNWVLFVGEQFFKTPRVYKNGQITEIGNIRCKICHKRNLINFHSKMDWEIKFMTKSGIY